MKRFEMPAAAGMILLSCRRRVEQGCAAQLLPPDRYSLKRKTFFAKNDGRICVDHYIYKLIGTASSYQMLLIHIESCTTRELEWNLFTSHNKFGCFTWFLFSAWALSVLE